MGNETSDVGYRVIKPQPAAGERGIKCGECGMKFDHGIAYGYSCPRHNCPVFTKVTL